MFRIPVLYRPKKANRVSSSYRPRIDELEGRWCPAVSHVTLNALVLSSHMVQLSGTVSGGLVAGLQVQFTGTVADVTTTDTNGNFSYTTSNASLGTVYAAGLINGQQSTDTAQATIAVAAPTLSLSISYGAQHNVMLSGRLTDLDAANQSISISGVAAGTPVTDSSGNFSLTTTASALGEVDATETDLWGQASNTATVMVSSTAPVIQDFAAVNSIGNMWIFTGRVVDNHPEGLVIRFGGIAGLVGRTVTVRADGTFSLTCMLPAGTHGTASAITTGWWGQDSDPVYYPVG
jgi:hypothetical protein